MNDNELNKALEQLAGDVPPMPADFHDRWMNAVRAEAGRTVPAETKETGDRTVFLVRWTRILSVAAAFVFLIGGTLLYRNQKKTLTAPKTADISEVPQETAEKMTDEAGKEVAEEAAGEAAEAPAAGAAPAPEPEALNAAGYDGTAEDAAELAAAVYDSAAYEAEEYEEAAEAACDTGEADRAYSAKTASGVSLNTLAADVSDTAEPMPEQTADPTAAPTAVPTEVPENEKTGLLAETGAFFTDMGDFLLAALPYLAVLAVPAAVALIIRRRKK